MWRAQNLIFFVKFPGGHGRRLIAAPSYTLKIEEARASAAAFSQLQSQLLPHGINAALPRPIKFDVPRGAAPVKSQLPTAILYRPLSTMRGCGERMFANVCSFVN